jgi:hypothetical protein
LKLRHPSLVGRCVASKLAQRLQQPFSPPSPNTRSTIQLGVFYLCHFDFVLLFINQIQHIQLHNVDEEVEGVYLRRLFFGAGGGSLTTPQRFTVMLVFHMNHSSYSLNLNPAICLALNNLVYYKLKFYSFVLLLFYFIDRFACVWVSIVWFPNKITFLRVNYRRLD